MTAYDSWRSAWRRYKEVRCARLSCQLDAHGSPASSTPSRVRRPANKLHAFSSQTSLSSSSSQMLTGSSYRPHKPMTRQPSMLGSDQAALFPLPPSVSGTPSRGLISSPHRRHRRTASYGTSSGVGPGEEATEFPFDRPLSGMISPQEVMLEDEEVQEGLAAFESGMRRLRELGAGAPRGKGKVKAEVDPYDGQRRRRGKDEVWEVMCGMADVLKREEGVRLLLDPQELVERSVEYSTIGAGLTDQRLPAHDGRAGYPTSCGWL